MAKIKLTKTELKAQRDALKRFSRYLPTLQLKKQQLQMETRRVLDELATLAAEEDAYRGRLGAWISVLDEKWARHLEESMTVTRYETTVRNVAGVDTPVFVALEFAPAQVDLFTTPIWFDDVLGAARQLAELTLRRQLLQEQAEALETELRTTTQRVNLFEKVKIPEAGDNIRRIQIYLGDAQTSAVGRAKIAKRKSQARENVSQ